MEKKNTPSQWTKCEMCCLACSGYAQSTQSHLILSNEVLSAMNNMVTKGNTAPLWTCCGVTGRGVKQPPYWITG